MEARAWMATRLPAPCGQCGQTVTPGQRWVVGHKIARTVRPELTWDPANWQPEHRECSDRSGAAAVAARDAVRSFPSEADRKPRDLPFSLPVEPMDSLAWDPDELRKHSWLADFADVPEDASPPTYMSPVPADAVGSYGADACQWIEETQRIRLRWWQRLAIVRQLEHRADGSLCHRLVLESTPRRAGKSVRIRGVALWRMEHGPRLFGEVQTVVHTGSDVAICREIQRGAWRWSEAEGWTVTKANGKEALESPTGDRWLVRAQDAVYGYDVCLGVVDEAWNVRPDTVSEGIEPATLERPSAQTHVTSTAHRRATSLMRTRLARALTEDEPGTLLLMWAAPSTADPGDESVWRAASPYWSEDRRAMIAGKYEAALSGQADPQADDLDPMAGFIAQYLNVWRLTKVSRAKGEAVVEEDTWSELAAPEVAPMAAPDAVAIETWFGPCSLAQAWRVGDRVLVSVTDHQDLATARAALDETGYRGKVTLGASLMEDAALFGVPARKGQGRAVIAAQALVRLQPYLLHDGGAHLSGQVLNLRTAASAEGPRLVSQGRADAVKAAVWAVEQCQAGAAKGQVRIITAPATR